MTVCDGHIHLNPGFADDVRRAADAENAARYSLLSLAQLRGDPAQNTETLLAKALDPARCFAFCSLDYERNGQPAPDPLEQVRLWLDAGFDGAECYYPRHDAGVTRRLLEICARRKLLVTAGSDCHGAFNRSEIGQTRTPVEKLRLGELIGAGAALGT